MTTETDLLPLPEWAACDETVADMSTTDVREAMNDYARACVSSATEALRAEVAEARGGWHMANGTAELAMKHRDAAEARAERLAEALRELKDLMLGQVKWEPCDCGCPQQRTPDGPHSATWLRAVQQVEIAISKAEGKE